METFRVPFFIDSVYAGCAKIDGLFIVSAANVTLEYRMTDNFVGVFNGPINTQTIALADLERAECGLGFFAPWLLLTARSMNAFQKLPGTDAAQLKFRIPWKHRRQLRTATSELNLLLSFQDADRYRRHLPDSA